MSTALILLCMFTLTLQSLSGSEPTGTHSVSHSLVPFGHPVHKKTSNDTHIPLNEMPQAITCCSYIISSMYNTQQDLAAVRKVGS